MTDILVIIAVIVAAVVVFELSKHWWRENAWRRRHRNARRDD